MSIFKKDGDFTTGPMTDKQRDAPVKPARPIEIYTGEPPQKDGKIEQHFTIQKECGFNGCKKKLVVERVHRQFFKRDELKTGGPGGGGMLEYDEHNVHQYAYCIEHGTKGPERWKANGDA